MSTSMVSLIAEDVVLTMGARSTTFTSSSAVSTSMTTFTSAAAEMPTATSFMITALSLGASARTSKVPGCKAGNRKVPSVLV